MGSTKVAHTGNGSQMSDSPTSSPTPSVRPPEDCSSMAEVREGVDAIDAALFAMLEQRFGYMRAAARIKHDRNSVRDEQRKAIVIDTIRERARKARLPDNDLSQIWDRLVESSISYELAEWDRLRNRP